MTRALERAGGRLKSKASPLQASLRTVHPVYGAQTVGRARLAATAEVDELDLIDPDAFEGAIGQFHTWARHVQEAALAIYAAAYGFSPAKRTQLSTAQQRQLDDASIWLRDQLQTLADERLYQPDPTEPARGEFDPSSRVPPGLVRTAIAIAGGATAVEAATSGPEHFAVTGDKPLGGIGTGELLIQAVVDEGILIEGWQWDYGPAYRLHPYEPHVDLDGTIAESALDFGEDDFGPAMPGSHPGCACLPLIPVYAEVTAGEGPAPVPVEAFGGE